MVICRLRVPLPESAWIAHFSRQFKEVRIDVLSRLDVDRNRSLTEIEVHTSTLEGRAEAIQGLHGVSSVEELEGSPGRMHLRVLHRTSPFIPIFRDLRLMHRFHFTIRGGDGFWVVVAPEAKHRALLARLRTEAADAVIESVRHFQIEGGRGALIPRQAELLRRAAAAGYFEVLRKITLTRLAKQLGMAVSSLSEALAIVEKKLVERRPFAK